MDRRNQQRYRKGTLLMNIKIIDPGKPESMQPLTPSMSILEVPVANQPFKSALLEKCAGLAKIDSSKTFSIRGDFWPDNNLLEQLKTISENAVVLADGEQVAWLSPNNDIQPDSIEIQAGDDSIILKYPWQFLAINEELAGALKEDFIEGTVRENVTIDGHIVLGKGSVILPGVYIEGNVIIGENCKIGPNCYIRGKTSVGDNCHIGQAVEVKNCILMTKVSAGHLSYLGDTIVGSFTNFGAGTITANFRHDGKNHRSVVNGELLDTGRRKFGSIIGEHVHTGINTAIYPGRKIWAGVSTLPGDIVKKDLQN
jgi:bifunctional UDP-N-acetylglucosamine pyrophosphorylase/glucosamine-1-phosphate N-acetyltransferase